MIQIRNAHSKSFAFVAIAAFSIFLIGCGQSTESSTGQESSSESQPQTAPAPDLPQAPDFTLPAANKGTEISLSQYQGEKPVVIVFYRAYW